jgi:hypothetical protein
VEGRYRAALNLPATAATNRLQALLKGRNTWTGKDGAQRTGLAIAWEVLPLARIGRKRPQHAEAPLFDDPLSSGPPGCPP